MARGDFRAWERYARTIGRIGNFTVSDQQPIPFFYGITRHERNFSWLHDTFIFTVSAPTVGDVETFVQLYPH